MNNYHTLILNVNDIEKRRQIVLPQIKQTILHGESFFITSSDEKIIDYLHEDLQSNNYNLFYLDLFTPDADWQWNPLQYPYHLYKSGKIDCCIDQLNLLAALIMDKDSNLTHQDPFWANSAADLFVAITLSLFKNAKSREVNLQSVLDVVVEGNKSFSTSTYIREYFLLDECKEYYKIAATYLNSPSDTRGSISSVFIQGLRNLLGAESFSRHLLADTIDIKNFSRYKTAIVVNISESSSYTTLVGMLFSQIFYSLINEGKELKHKNSGMFTFYFDKFLSIGRIPQIERILPISLDYKMCFTFFADNIAMLENVYGVSVARAIKEYCERWVVFPTRDTQTLNDITTIIKTYAESQNNNVSHFLTRDKPIVINEEQKIEQYIIPTERFTINKLYERKYDLYLPSKANIFSVQDFTTGRKREILFSKLEQTDKSLAEKRCDLSYDTEELIKRIDMKISELEAEERQNAENGSNNN